MGMGKGSSQCGNVDGVDRECQLNTHSSSKDASELLVFKVERQRLVDKSKKKTKRNQIDFCKSFSQHLHFQFAFAKKLILD